MIVDLQETWIPIFINPVMHEFFSVLITSGYDNSRTKNINLKSAIVFCVIMIIFFFIPVGSDILHKSWKKNIFHD